MSELSSIRLHDTPQRSQSELAISPSEATGIYTCGPTVYKDAHIGNMRAYMTADLLRRAVLLAGGTPNQVINITDVGHLTSDADTGDDKVEKSARESGKTAWDIANVYEGNFWEDYDALGMQRPEVIAKATEHIPEQIELIARLEEAGMTYQTPDGIYFDTTAFPDYANFAKLDLQGLSGGKRIDLGDKRNVADFALWKFFHGPGKRDMQWDSPWGSGFPGWHIECSAMAMKYLGPEFDIHTGGVDHIPVHHTNEIAQAQAVGDAFAKHWLHTAFLLDETGNKMSKSEGKSLRLPDVMGRYGISAAGMRYMYLTHHYRGPLGFSEEKATQASVAHSRLLDTAALHHGAANHIAREGSEPAVVNPSEVASALWTEFVENIASDLNSPAAVDVVHKVTKHKQLSSTEKDALLARMDEVLGLGISSSIGEVTLSDRQQEILDRRAQAREDKDFLASDALRDELLDDGIRVIDSPAGQVTRMAGA